MNLEQALFPMTLEPGAARRRLAEMQGHVICTVPEAWERVKDTANPPLQVITAGSIELADLTRLAAYVPEDAKAVVGLGGEAGQGVPWDEELATIAGIVLDELEAAAPEIAAVSDAGIGFIAGAHRLVGAARQASGHARFEEGSEHFLAYVIEWISGRRPAHGELIAFCALVMSYVQGEDPQRAVRIIQETGIDARPGHLGIDGPLLARCFAELPDYAVREHLDASVIELVELTPGLASAAFAHTSEATGD